MVRFSVSSQILTAAKLPKLMFLYKICPNVFSNFDQLCPKFCCECVLLKQYCFKQFFLNILHQIDQNSYNSSLIALVYCPNVSKYLHLRGNTTEILTFLFAWETWVSALGSMLYVWLGMMIRHDVTGQCEKF